jgi:hypothetical protein
MSKIRSIFSLVILFIFIIGCGENNIPTGGIIWVSFGPDINGYSPLTGEMLENHKIHVGWNVHDPSVDSKNGFIWLTAEESENSPNVLIKYRRDGKELGRFEGENTFSGVTWVGAYKNDGGCFIKYDDNGKNICAHLDENLCMVKRKGWAYDRCVINKKDGSLWFNNVHEKTIYKWDRNMNEVGRLEGIVLINDLDVDENNGNLWVWEMIKKDDDYFTGRLLKIKSDVSGYEDWGNPVGDVHEVFGYCASNDEDGGVFLVCSVEEKSNGYKQIWIYKYDAMGNIVAKNIIENTRDVIEADVLGYDGGLIILGYDDLLNLYLWKLDRDLNNIEFAKDLKCYEWNLYPEMEVDWYE